MEKKNGTLIEKLWTYQKVKGGLAYISSIAGMPTTSSQSEHHFLATAEKVAIYSGDDNFEFSVWNCFCYILNKNLILIFCCYIMQNERGGGD